MRIVRAKTYGAISILNAIPTGIGGAFGVDLHLEAEVEVLEEPGRIEAVIPEGEDPKLVIETAKTVLEYAGRSDIGLRIKTRSNIPIGRGLKSSSAASNAVALAVAKLIGLKMPLEKILELAIRSSIKAGVTITGAYDDAYTSLFGGINITDNYGRRLLVREQAPENLRIVISIPEKKIYTRSIDRSRLTRVREVYLKAAQLALRRRFWDAMILNGLATALALELEPSPIIESFRAGALGAGISGTGPAIAAVVEPEKLEAVREVLEPYGRTIICNPNNLQASWEVISNG
ncbi:MAG: shikimate kinase [Thaumarchaeota archaeon]|nr:MAG: shikimate kinase [Nitrososphaerota archaeon]